VIDDYFRDLETFTLHHCATICDFGGWVFSFIIISYGYVSGEAICTSVYIKS